MADSTLRDITTEKHDEAGCLESTRRVNLQLGRGVPCKRTIRAAWISTYHTTTAVEAAIEHMTESRKELHDRLEKERSELAAEIATLAKARVFQHGETLALKQRQLVSKDHYGNYLLDRFQQEVDYFVRTVMTKDIDPAIWTLLFPDRSPVQVFHQAYGEYLRERGDSPSDVVEIVPGMTAREFEFFCCEILQLSGWEARATVGSGDQGIDLIATLGGKKLVVQCKLYNNSPVGNAAVQEIIAGRIYEKADYAAVVTNATYTPSAIGLANTANVLLLHYSELSRLSARLGLGASAAIADQKAPRSIPVRPAVDTSASRPLNEIVQQVELLNSELQQAALADGRCDPLYEKAKEVVLRHRRASIALVQRHLQIGYNRAARLLESMERDGLVSKMSSNGNRELTRILEEKDD